MKHALLQKIQDGPVQLLHLSEPQQLMSQIVVRLFLFIFRPERRSYFVDVARCLFLDVGHFQSVVESCACSLVWLPGLAQIHGHAHVPKKKNTVKKEHEQEEEGKEDDKSECARTKSENKKSPVQFLK